MKKPAAFEATRALCSKTNTGAPCDHIKEHLFMNTKNVSTKTDKAQILLQGRRMTWAELSVVFAARKAQLLSEVAV